MLELTSLDKETRITYVNGVVCHVKRKIANLDILTFFCFTANSCNVIEVMEKIISFRMDWQMNNQFFTTLCNALPLDLKLLMQIGRSRTTT